MLFLVLCYVYEIYVVYILLVCLSMYVKYHVHIILYKTHDESCLRRMNDMSCMHMYVSYEGYVIKIQKYDVHDTYVQ